MLPNIDLRIATMIKALEQVILPALPRDQRLARDQAMLVVGHLNMLGGQWKRALRFEQVSLDDLVGLARALLPAVDATFDAPLTEAIDAAQACDQADVLALERANSALGRIVDLVILGGDDHLALTQAAQNAVLEYALRHARRERTWFQANNMDPDHADLPTIEESLAVQRPVHAVAR